MAAQPPDGHGGSLNVMPSGRVFFTASWSRAGAFRSAVPNAPDSAIARQADVAILVSPVASPPAHAGVLLADVRLHTAVTDLARCAALASLGQDLEAAGTAWISASLILRRHAERTPQYCAPRGRDGAVDGRRLSTSRHAVLQHHIHARRFMFRHQAAFPAFGQGSAPPSELASSVSMCISDIPRRISGQRACWPRGVQHWLHGRPVAVCSPIYRDYRHGTWREMRAVINVSWRYEYARWAIPSGRPTQSWQRWGFHQADPRCGNVQIAGQQRRRYRA